MLPSPTATAVEAAPGGGGSLWSQPAADGSPQILLHFFWSETCPHCIRAKRFLAGVDAERPWLVVRSHEVTRSAVDRELFALMASAVGREIRGVPAFFLCGRMLVGFDDDAGTGRRLLDMAARCQAELAAATGEALPEANGDATRVALPLLGETDVARLALPVATALLGGLDAFNPCAFFVLLFLLSLLIHSRSRTRMAIVGGVFVAFSGLIYFAFMAAWLNLFLLLRGLELITTLAGAAAIALGLVNIKDFFWFKRGVTLGISEAGRIGLIARMRGLVSAERLPTMLAGTVALAAVANLYELLCTSGFPLVYTRILTLHDMPAFGYYLYLALYNAVYVLPLGLIVAIFILTLGSRKLSERGGRALKLLSGFMMAGLGLVLVIAPALLDNLLTAVGLLLGALVVTTVAVVIDDRIATRPR